MGFLSILLLVVFAIGSLLLIGVVMIQDDQGEGLGGLFGGGGGASFGSRSGNILTKATTVLGAVFLVSSFVLAWINRTPEAGDVLGAARRGSAQESTAEAWWIVDDESDGDQSTIDEAGGTDTPTIEATDESESSEEAAPETTSEE